MRVSALPALCWRLWRNVTVSIMRVVASANNVAGIAANQASGGIASVTVSSSVLYGNTIAAQATGGAGLLSYSNNQVIGNATDAALLSRQLALKIPRITY